MVQRRKRTTRRNRRTRARRSRTMRRYPRRHRQRGGLLGFFEGDTDCTMAPGNNPQGYMKDCCTNIIGIEDLSKNPQCSMAKQQTQQMQPQ
jgi:hypothetical protein